MKKVQQEWSILEKDLPGEHFILFNSNLCWCLWLINHFTSQLIDCITKFDDINRKNLCPCL